MEDLAPTSTDFSSYSVPKPTPLHGSPHFFNSQMIWVNRWFPGLQDSSILQNEDNCQIMKLGYAVDLTNMKQAKGLFPRSATPLIGRDTHPQRN